MTAETVKSLVVGTMVSPKPVTLIASENQALPPGSGPAHKSYVCHGHKESSSPETVLHYHHPG